MKLFTKICFPALLCLIGSYSYSQKLPTYLYGELQSRNRADSISVVFWPDYLGANTSYPTEYYYLPLKRANILHGTMPGNEMLEISRELDKPAYVTLSIPGSSPVSKFILMPGDSIGFLTDRDKGMSYFFGPQSINFEVQYLIQRLIEQGHKNGPMYFITKSKDDLLQLEDWQLALEEAKNKGPFRNLVFVEENDIPSHTERKLLEDYKTHPAFSLLETYRPLISDGLYRILKTDLTGYFLYRKFDSFHSAIDFHNNGPEMMALYEELLRPIPWDIIPFEEQAGSAWFQDYLMSRTKVESKITGIDRFEILNTNLQGTIRERMLVQHLQSNYKIISDLDDLMAKAKATIHDPFLLYVLDELHQSVQVGNPVLDLRLTDTKGNELFLSDFKGKTLLLDFWFTGCHPCVLLYESTLKPLKESLKGREDIAILSINVDRKMDSWQKSVVQGKYSSPDGHNFYLGNRASHPFLKNYRITGYPTLMVIDREGKLYSYSGTPRNLEVLEKLVLEAAQN